MSATPTAVTTLTGSNMVPTLVNPVSTGSEKGRPIGTTKSVHVVGPGIGGGGAGGSMASRFQEAGISLSRNRFRNLTGGASGSGHLVPTPQQVQINLDHDYCSSNRARKSRGNGGAPYVTGVANSRTGEVRRPGQPSSGGSGAGASSSPSSSSPVSRTIIRVSSTPVNMKRLRETATHVVAVARSNAPLAAAILAASTKPDPPPSPPSHPAMLQQQRQYHPSFVTNVTVPSPVKLAGPATTPLRVEIKEELRSEVGLFSEDSTSPPCRPRQVGASRRGSQRRDSDPKKDSGLESGDVSDSSMNNEEDTYSKLPPYLTTLGAAAVVSTSAPGSADSAIVASSPFTINVKSELEEEDGAVEDHVYDRLPCYVKGVSRSSSAQSLSGRLSADVPDNSSSSSKTGGGGGSATKCDTKTTVIPVVAARRSLRRRQNSSSSSSGSGSSSSGGGDHSSDSSDHEQISIPASKSPRTRSVAAAAAAAVGESGRQQRLRSRSGSSPRPPAPSSSSSSRRNSQQRRTVRNRTSRRSRSSSSASSSRSRSPRKSSSRLRYDVMLTLQSIQ